MANSMIGPSGFDVVDAADGLAGHSLNRSFFSAPVERVARKLIGTLLLFDGVGGVIVETEPYNREDPASHNARGRTTRNRTMFGPPGHAYVYRSYGLHWCLKFVCGVTAGSAVLVRAIRPVTGLDAMRVRRGDVPEIKLCTGPGRFCAALGIDAHWDGHDLMQPLRAPGRARRW